MSKIVDRTLDFFELFATQKRPLSLTDLSRLLKIPASSCHDVIRALEARGYVYETAPRAGYYPTRRFFDMFEKIVAHDSVIQRSRPILEQARDQLEETVTLSKATDLQVIYLLVVEPDNPVRYSVTAGTPLLSLHATSAGKALLGSLPPDAFAQYLKNAELTRHTSRTITTKTRLAADIKESQTRGWYLNHEETRPGVLTVSTPFLWNRGLHVFTVAGPADRMARKLERAARTAMQAGRELGDPRRVAKRRPRV